MVACIYFTSKGERIARKLEKEIEDIQIFDKSDYKSNMEHIMRNYKKIIFISSCGIAVRMIAPYLKNKWEDPAVLVVDELGKHVISLISGHFGGANQFCLKVAEFLGAQPVITTASDINGFEAPDVYALRKGLYIENPEEIKKVTSLMLDGKPITFITDIPIEEIRYDNLSQQGEAYIIVTYKKNIKAAGKPLCILRPKILCVGMGFRKNIGVEDLKNSIIEVCDKNDLSVKSIGKIGTIEIKKGDEAVIKLAEYLNAKLYFFKLDEIKKVQGIFPASSFVQKNVGVSSVAEPCAYLLSEKLIVRKTAVGGVTIAISRESW